jgi:UDP-2,3-diacylglucosamine hydrolase
MKICIFAAKGDLPKEIYDKALKDKIDCKVIILEPFGDSDFFNSDDIIGFIKIGEVGKSIEICKKNSISHITFAGGVERPDLLKIKPDFEGAKLIANILKNKFLGDDNLLKIVLKYFESKGFEILPASKFLDDYIIETQKKPSESNLKDIDVALQAFKIISEIDVGQSMIVSNGRIIAIEAAEGSAKMIERSKDFITSSAIVLKIPKIFQDKRVDMPTIGPETLDQIQNSNIDGLAISNDVIILNKKEFLKKADELGIFLHYINYPISNS